MKKAVIASLLVVALSLFSCKRIADPDYDGGSSLVPVYEGPISELAITMDASNALHIWTELIDDTIISGARAQGYNFMLHESFDLLAAPPLETFVATPLNGPRLLGKELGFENQWEPETTEMKFESFSYGKQLYALGASEDENGKISKFWGDMTSDTIRFFCVKREVAGGYQLGWIKYYCDGTAYINPDGNWDTDIKIYSYHMAEVNQSSIKVGEGRPELEKCPVVPQED